MATLSTKTSHKITARASDLTAQDLKDFVENLDNEAKVRVSVSQGNQMEPTVVTLEATVDLTKGRIY